MSETEIAPVSFSCIVCHDDTQFAMYAVRWYKIVDDRRVLPMKAAHIGCLTIEQLDEILASFAHDIRNSGAAPTKTQQYLDVERRRAQAVQKTGEKHVDKVNGKTYDVCRCGAVNLPEDEFCMNAAHVGNITRVGRVGNSSILNYAESAEATMDAAVALATQPPRYTSSSRLHPYGYERVPAQQQAATPIRDLIAQAGQAVVTALNVGRNPVEQLLSPRIAPKLTHPGERTIPPAWCKCGANYSLECKCEPPGEDKGAAELETLRFDLLEID